MKGYLKFEFRSLKERDDQLKAFERIGGYYCKIDKDNPLVVWVKV